MKTFRLCVIFTFSIFLTACKGASFDMQVVRQSSQCYQADSAFALISNANELKHYNIFDDANELESVNFKDNVFLFVSAGTQPSSGYRYEVIGSQASIKNNKVVLPLRFIKPKRGAFQLQELTSPCVLVSFNRVDIEKYLDKDIEIILQGNAIANLK